jgi:hypothetical protein
MINMDIEPAALAVVQGIWKRLICLAQNAALGVFEGSIVV